MWFSQAKFVLAVVVVVFCGDRVLLLRHSYRPRYPWGLPTGWVRYGETAEQAARREVAEETGIVLDRPIWLGSQLPFPDHLESVFWAEISADRVIAPSGDGEITGGQWVIPGQWPEGLWPPQISLITRAAAARQGEVPGDGLG